MTGHAERAVGADWSDANANGAQCFAEAVAARRFLFSAILVKCGGDDRLAHRCMPYCAYFDGVSP